MSRSGLALPVAATVALFVAFVGVTASAAHAARPFNDGASVTGRVVDAQTSRPLADAHVFIATSTIGGITTADGRFHLRQVPAGAHTVYVSMLGYTPARVDMLVRSGQKYIVDVELTPTVVEGPEVTVTAERDPAWYKRLKKFTRLFIGESPNAEQCVIENPEVLSFDARWWGKLTAQAREPLVVTNRALGYRVTYFLEEFEAQGGTIRFDGEPLFELLPAPDSAAAAHWRSARRSAYEGSFRHFMKSLIQNTYRNEGFRVNRRYDLEGGLDYGNRFGFERDGVLSPGPSADETRLDFHGYIEVVYEPERADPEYLRWHYGTKWHRHSEQRSLIELTDGPTRVDAHGEVVDPYGVTVYGYFAYERVGDLVPKEYAP